jgi:hypothetical protein
MGGRQWRQPPGLGNSAAAEPWRRAKPRPVPLATRATFRVRSHNRRELTLQLRMETVGCNITRLVPKASLTQRQWLSITMPPRIAKQLSTMRVEKEIDNCFAALEYAPPKILWAGRICGL